MYLRTYQDAGMGLVVVRGVHTVESLLAGCVPEVCRQSERKVGFTRRKCVTMQAERTNPQFIRMDISISRHHKCTVTRDAQTINEPHLHA